MDRAAAAVDIRVPEQWSTRYTATSARPRFSDDELELVVEYASRRRYARGSVVVSEGDEGHSLYVILSGWLKVYTTTHAGKEIILGMIGPGEYFGELSLLDDAPRSESVKANEACELLVVPKGKLAECLARHPRLYPKLLRDLSSKVRRVTDELKRLASMDVYQRIAKLLLELATADGDRLVVTQKLTQQDLANWICASREMVSRVLQDLVVGGYIALDRRRIVIKKRLPERW